jgi:anti-sigma-K factor RskA
MTADLHTLTGAYAVDGLGADERSLFERHLAECEPCRREVRELQATAARLGFAAAQTPPPQLRDRVLAAAAGTRQLPPVVDELSMARRDRVRRWAPRLTAVAAAVLLVATVVLGVQNARLDDQVQTSQQSAAQLQRVLTAPDAKVVRSRVSEGGQARLVVSRQQSTALFLASGMDAAPRSKAYQLWLIGPGGARSVGLVTPASDGTARASLSELGDAREVGMTVEPAGGSQQPTSDPVVLVDVPQA